MTNHGDETIELESQPLNTEKKAELLSSSQKTQKKEKILPIGLTKKDLSQYSNDPFWCRLRNILFTLFWFLWLSMFVCTFVIINYFPNCPAISRLKWYQRESIAQIDFNGVFGNNYERFANPKNMKPFMDAFQTRSLLLPNLFNASVNGDKAIMDHFQVNTLYGSEKELSNAIRNLRADHATNVIMDFDPSITSRKHEWFELFKQREGKYANYYLIADSDYDGYTNFGTEKMSGIGSLITKDGRPVLNLMNPDVRAELKKVFERWGRLNIKGYRFLGGPYLLMDDQTQRVTKSVELNRKFIKALNRDLKSAVSDGVFILQLDDQDADSYTNYFGTQEDPVADMVVNKFLARLDLSNSTLTMQTLLSQYINGSKIWNDNLPNIGPWTGWLVEESNEKRSKDDLLTCFSNILGYTLPRGTPLTRISTSSLHIGLPSVYFEVLRNFNNLSLGTYDNVRIMSKLMNLRKSHANTIMLGKTEFVEVKVNGLETNEVFVMIRSDDKNGLLVISNLKGDSKMVSLNLDFNRFPTTAEVTASCKIKQGHLIGSILHLNRPFELHLNESLIATFEMAS